MLFLKESVWLLLANSAIGFILGYFKGMPRVGFLLGLFLGPIGWGIALLLPSQNSKFSFRFGSMRPGEMNQQNNGRRQYHSEDTSLSNSNCPRCGQSMELNAKACSKCGSVMIPVQYQVLDEGKKSPH